MNINNNNNDNNTLIPAGGDINIGKVGIQYYCGEVTDTWALLGCRSGGADERFLRFWHVFGPFFSDLLSIISYVSSFPIINIIDKGQI